MKLVDHAWNSTLKTSHSRVVKRPLALPVKAVLESALREYLKLLQLIGNSAFDFYTLPLSTMQMSQQPKMGPFSGLQAMANWARLSPYLSLRSSENMNEFIVLSAAQCFLLEFHGRGVQPPITLPYQVSMIVSVCGISSQTLWKSLTENLFSLALKSKEKRLTFCLGKSDLMKSYSWMALSILLSISTMSGAELTDEKVEPLSDFSLGISLMQISLAFSRSASICFWILRQSSKMKFVSICLSSLMKRAEMTWCAQAPLMLLQLPSLRRLMKFIVSWEQPQRLTHFLKLRCSSLTFLIREEKKFSISSWKEQNSGTLLFLFSQMMFSNYSQPIFSQPSWNSPHPQPSRRNPDSHRKPGLRQEGFMQMFEQRLPQMHQGVVLIGLFIQIYYPSEHPSQPSSSFFLSLNPLKPALNSRNRPQFQENPYPQLRFHLFLFLMFPGFKSSVNMLIHNEWINLKDKMRIESVNEQKEYIYG